MDANKRIIGMMVGVDQTELQKILAQTELTGQEAAYAAAANLFLFYDNNDHEIINLNEYDLEDKKNVIVEWRKYAVKNDGMAKDEFNAYRFHYPVNPPHGRKADDPVYLEQLSRAFNHLPYIPSSNKNSNKAKSGVAVVTTDNQEVEPEVTREEIYQSIEAEKKKARKQGVAITLGALAAAIGIGSAGYALGHKGNQEEVIDEPQVANELQINTVKEVNLENLSPEEMLALITNENQKQLYTNMYSFLTSVNAQESWERVTLTDEQMDNYNITDPEAIYGFTAEEVYSLALRFNSYTNEEYLAITGGNEFNPVTVMNDSYSMSNGALSKIAAYYIHSNECDLGIDKILNFTDSEKAEIEKLETLFREYHELENAENEKDALAKMKEIKTELQEYGYDTKAENSNGRSYILRTFISAASIISNTHQYQDTISVEVYNTKTQQQETKEIKVELFDELTMRSLVTGYGSTDNVSGFDSEEFLENHGLSSSKYNLLYSDTERSIADQSCGAQQEKLEQALNYIREQTSQNLNSETTFATMNGIDVSISGTDVSTLNNVVTEYDKHVEGTIDASLLNDKLDDYLIENNLYPKNTEYFSIYFIAEKQIAYKDTHGVTAGKKGDVIRGETVRTSGSASSLTNSGGVFKNSAGQTITAAEALEAARAEADANNPNYEYSATTPEEEKQVAEQVANSQGAIDRTAMLQNVYDVTYDYYYTGSASGYNSSWASSSDSEIAARHAVAVRDATERKNLDAQVEAFNQQQQQNGNIIYDEFQNAETSTTQKAPVESVNKTTTTTTTTQESVTVTPPTTNNSTTVVTPTPTPTPEANNQQEVIQDSNNIISSEFDGADIKGDIVIGDGNQNSSETNSTGGFSSTPPAGLAPVVTSVDEPSATSYLDEVDAYAIENITDEQLEQFMMEMEQNSVSSNDLDVKTR